MSAPQNDLSRNFLKLRNLIDDIENMSIPNKYQENIEEDNRETICDSKKRRFTFFPIEYPTLYDSYQRQKANHWTAEEIDFTNDSNDFQELNSDVQHFIKHILAFFASSDGIVNFGLGRFIDEIVIMEAQVMYRYQAAMEDVHSHVYSLMLENIVKDPIEKKELFEAIHTVPSIKKMADWALKWIKSSESLAHRIVANAVVEGIFFSGAFAAIFWIKKHFNHKSEGSFLKGLTTSNAWIARDEGQHCESACLIYDLLDFKLEHNEIYQIVDEAVNISKVFMSDALPIRLIGMNVELMNNYIEYVADWLLSMLNIPKFYNKRNPFDFMIDIGLDSKTNFFEIRNDTYRKPEIDFNKTSWKVNIDISSNF